VVYNNVHMMMYEADAARRKAWIASVDAIAALRRTPFVTLRFVLADVLRQDRLVFSLFFG
jgi:hypothetical protein